MVTQQASDERIEPVSALAVIAAILLPPLGIFLQRGITPAFWITVVLTIVGWLPGVLFALVLLFAPRAIAIR